MSIILKLSTIPILIKKKRTVADGAHGTYYCTLNSNNDYVEYYTNNPQGDINNPDTWSKVESTKEQDSISYVGDDGQVQTKVRNKCVFLPPLNARNFNVTVVGGGGGGHDGTVEYHEFLNVGASSSSFLPNSIYSDYYDLILIAGKGGRGAPGAVIIEW